MLTPSADVELRPVEDADLPIFLAHQADPVAAAMAAFTTRAPDAFSEHWAKIRADPTGVARTITADGVVVGDILCWLQDGRREVGYWIGREWWGRGYATGALRLLLAEVVADRPIHARAVDHNVGSRRVLERNGFVRIGQTDADGFSEGIYRLD